MEKVATLTSGKYQSSHSRCHRIWHTTGSFQAALQGTWVWAEVRKRPEDNCTKHTRRRDSMSSHLAAEVVAKAVLAEGSWVVVVADSSIVELEQAVDSRRKVDRHSRLGSIQG